MLGPDTPVHLQPARDPRRRQGRRGHRDGARRLRLPAARRHRHLRRPQGGLRRLQRRPARRRPPARPRAWSAPTCSRPTAAIFKPQGEAINAGAADDIKVLVVGNPANTNALIALSQRARRPARALHRDDAPRPQPRDRPARRQARRRASPTITNMTVWGNHSPTQYPDLVQRQGERRERPGDAGRRRGLDRRTSSSRRVAKRGAAIIDARGASSARPRPPTPRSTTSTTGCSARPTATGSRWASRPTAPTASPRGSSPASRAPARAASTTIVEGLEIDDVLPRADRRDASTSSSEERDAGRARPGLGRELRPVRPLRPGGSPAVLAHLAVLLELADITRYM